ncbi:MAG: putative ATPase [Sulfurimonas sp.]|jgi:predicted ATPase
MPNLNLKNFAKIQDSDFDIKDITVFAGKPGTGKSYIMKMLYAMSGAVHYNHPQHESLLERLVSLKLSDDMNIENSIKVKDELSVNYKNILNSIFENLNQIGENFIVESKSIKLEYINSKLKLELLDSKSALGTDNSIFVETPLILEFYQFLDKTPYKTPYHIESLMNVLKEDYSPTTENEDEFIKYFVNKTKDVINGNIKNEGQSFSFTNSNEQKFNIINASSGIKSIGLLQYLVTNKALKKGSILFWEEPEVHLHPTWQLKMVDLFIELMNAGVKIVFSTHSPFMADYLNAKSTREKFRDRISFNLLSEEDVVVSNAILNDDNWNLLQDELLGSLEDIMWQYL